MRLRIVIAIVIAIVVVLAVVFRLRPERRATLPSTPPETGSAANTMPAHPSMAKQGASGSDNVARSVATNITVIESPIHQQVQTPQGFKEYAERKNVPVEFYGRFIDQDSNALVGVAIRVIVRHWTAPIAFQVGSQDIPLERTSDADGRFVLTGATGDGFDITSVNKSGYELEPGGRSFYATGGTFGSPVIFKMWSTNIHEQLIAGQKKFQIVPDGRPYVIDLTQGTIAESGPGELKVWIQYTNTVVQGQLYDWAAGVEVINGGLLEEPYNSAMYCAPPDGYTNAFQIQAQIKGGQSGEIGDRSFYLRLKNGQEYGRMNINLYAPYGHLYPGLIWLSYAINPSGSPILR